MGKLVPEKRLDKNGRAVTRHVKDGSDNTSKASKIPSPSLGKADQPMSLSVEKRIRSNILKLAGVTHNSYGEGIGISTLKYLAKRSPQELRALEKDLRNGSPWFRSTWGATLNSIKFAPNNGATEDMLPHFQKTKEIVAVVSILTEGDIAPDGTRLRGAALRGIVGKVSPTDHGSTRAALLAAWILPRQGHNAYSSIDYDLHRESLEYIKENFDEVMSHRHLLHERGSIDREVIEMVISSEAPAIISGVL